MGKRKELSHEELWDDSALIRSWDEALQEYNLYHSIHARGERVEDVVKEAEDDDSNSPAKDSYEVSAANNNDCQHVNGDSAATAEVSGAQSVHTQENAGMQEVPHQSADIPMPQVPGIASNMTGTDPALKNLMMSWYYAGYYSGLYDGQKSTSNNAQHQGSTGTGVGEKNTSGT